MNNNHPAALETTQKMTLCNTFSLFTTRLSFHPPLHLPPCLVLHLFIFNHVSLSPSPWSHSQDCRACQEDLINTIRRHVCSLVLMRSITRIAIMFLFLLCVRWLQKRETERHRETRWVGLWSRRVVVWEMYCASVCVCAAAACRGRGRVGFAYTPTDGKREGV